MRALTMAMRGERFRRKRARDRDRFRPEQTVDEAIADQVSS